MTVVGWTRKPQIDKQNVLLAGGACLVFVLCVALVMTVYVWGIVGLFNPSTEEGCSGLHTLDIGLVSLITFGLVVLVAMCLCTSCFGGSSDSNLPRGGGNASSNV